MKYIIINFEIMKKYKVTMYMVHYRYGKLSFSLTFYTGKIFIHSVFTLTVNRFIAF